MQLPWLHIQNIMEKEQEHYLLLIDWFVTSLHHKDGSSRASHNSPMDTWKACWNWTKNQLLKNYSWSLLQTRDQFKLDSTNRLFQIHVLHNIIIIIMIYLMDRDIQYFDNRSNIYTAFTFTFITRQRFRIKSSTN